MYLIASIRVPFFLRSPFERWRSVGIQKLLARSLLEDSVKVMQENIL